jgi:hypothetical protein
MTNDRIDEFARRDQARDPEGERRGDAGRDVDHRPAPGAFGREPSYVDMASTVTDEDRGEVDAQQAGGAVHHPPASVDHVRSVQDRWTDREPAGDPESVDAPTGAGRPGARLKGEVASDARLRPGTARVETFEPRAPERDHGPRPADPSRAPGARPRKGLRAIPGRLLRRLRGQPLVRRALHTLTETSRAVTRTLERIEHGD